MNDPTFIKTFSSEFSLSNTKVNDSELALQPQFSLTSTIGNIQNSTFRDINSTLTNSVIMRNALDSSMVMTNSTFLDIDCSLIDGRNTNFTMQDSTLSNVDGQDLYVVQITKSPSITLDSLTTSNLRSNNGKSISLRTSDLVHIVNSMFSDNQQTILDFETIDSVQYTNNTIMDSTKGIYVSKSNIAVSNSTFKDLGDEQQSGSGIQSFDSDLSVSDNTQFIDSIALQGAAIDFNCRASSGVVCNLSIEDSSFE